MSANKYANLPDIDTAPDIYESEEAVLSQHGKGDASEDESGVPTRRSASALRAKNADAGREELDSSSLMSTEDAGKKFRKAEKRRDRPRTLYAYPPSPTSPTFPMQTRNLTTRMRMLQDELAALEAETADPSNPLLHIDHEGNKTDPGELIKNLVDIRGRLEKVKKGREGRGRLMEFALGHVQKPPASASLEPAPLQNVGAKDEKDATSVADVDRRVGELEALVGAATMSLDDVSSLPAPLLPMLTKLNTQLTLLTQPRHLDSISRRLKLLLSDLDRVSSSQQQSAHRRQSSHHAPQSPGSASAPSPLQEQLAPLLTRLAPTLPHIPHILTRLRTLSALHTSASEFQGTLESLEEEQRRVRGALDELSRAVESVEKSLEDNGSVVKGNIGGLEERVESLVKRLADVS